MTSISISPLSVVLGFALMSSSAFASASPAFVPPLPPTVPGVTVAFASPGFVPPLPPTVPGVA